MKTEKFFAFALVALLALVSGCQSGFGRAADNLAFTPTDFRTNIVAVRTVDVLTNEIVVRRAVDAATGVVTLTTSREPVTVSLTLPGQTNVEAVAWKPNENTVAQLRAVGGLLPGYGDAISGCIVALLGAVAAFRGRKYRAAAISIAQGVESVTRALPEHAAEIISAQKKWQDTYGTRETVKPLLKELA